MTTQFLSYTKLSLDALRFNPKKDDIISKKKDIILSVAENHNGIPSKILFIGFNPLLLSGICNNVWVTEIDDEIKKYLDQENVKYNYIDKDDLGNHYKKFNWVIALDEYFTFSFSEEEQLDKIKLVVNLATETVVTSLKDYKNQSFKDKEFSQPLAIRKNQDSLVFLEYHDHDYSDRNGWKTFVYKMLGDEVDTLGPLQRRSMFFKQLAKFSIDAGAQNFYVHKNLMYKSLIKKNYEHVISINI